LTHFTTATPVPESRLQREEPSLKKVKALLKRRKISSSQENLHLKKPSSQAKRPQ